jgi:hypothetical protein
VDATIEVATVGSTDETGTEARNEVLASQRSAYLQRQLSARNIASRAVVQQSLAAEQQRGGAHGNRLHGADARSASVLVEVRRVTP